MNGPPPLLLTTRPLHDAVIMTVNGVDARSSLPSPLCTLRGVDGRALITALPLIGRRRTLRGLLILRLRGCGLPTLKNRRIRKTLGRGPLVRDCRLARKDSPLAMEDVTTLLPRRVEALFRRKLVIFGVNRLKKPNCRPSALRSKKKGGLVPRSFFLN